MNIDFRGNIEEISGGIGFICEGMGFKQGEGECEIEIKKREQGFFVDSNGKKALLEYSRPVDFFRALSFCVDSFRNNKPVSIEQKPSFDTCGIMIDVSRRAVLRVETVKDIMRRMARMGLNQLMLYTEDTYEMKKYPYFGYMRGRYTAEELKEIVAYGNKLGIETVPCIQTLAHLARALRWPDFEDMRESQNILFIGEEKTYELIDEMLKTARECFTTSKIHIGMDEAHGVGLGKYLEKHGYTDRFKLLCGHLERVLEIASKYGFEPMMWSDMFFRLGSKTGDYYDTSAKMPDNIAELIPKGIQQVYWDYYNTSSDMYEFMIQAHQQMGCPIVFAGGVWTWGSPSVNYCQTFKSTAPALEACRKYGIKDVFATMWGDDGAECSVYQALLGMQLYAQYNYGGETEGSGLAEAFRICAGCDAEAFLLFDADNFEENDSGAASTAAKQVLYQNPLTGLLDKNFEMIDLKSHYGDILNKLEKLPNQGEFEEMFECQRSLVRVLRDKCDIGIRLKKAYDAKDKKALGELSGELFDLEKNILVMHERREHLWDIQNKPFGFEEVGMHLGGLEASVRRAAKRAAAYAEGKIDAIDELAEERLYYNGKKSPFVHDYFSVHTMMP